MMLWAHQYANWLIGSSFDGLLRSSGNLRYETHKKGHVLGDYSFVLFASAPPFPFLSPSFSLHAPCHNVLPHPGPGSNETNGHGLNLWVPDGKKYIFPLLGWFSPVMLAVRNWLIQYVLEASVVQESHFSVTLCCEEKHIGTSKCEIILMETVVRIEG